MSLYPYAPFPPGQPPPPPEFEPLTIALFKFLSFGTKIVLKCSTQVPNLMVRAFVKYKIGHMFNYVPDLMDNVVVKG